jgi:hypothetical protein
VPNARNCHACVRWPSSALLLRSEMLGGE